MRVPKKLMMMLGKLTGEQRLLGLFPGGNEVVMTCSVNGTDISYFIHQHIGNGLYWRSSVRSNNFVVDGEYMRIWENSVCEFYKGYSNGTTPALTNSNWTWSPNVGFLTGGYYQGFFADSYLEIQTEIGCSCAGAMAYPGLTGAGALLVTIDGDATLADLLPTAQDLVTGGALDPSVLVANGGTLNPTDRIMDCYNLTSNGLLPAGVGTTVMFSRSLAPGVHTIRITHTAYRNVAASGGVFTGIFTIYSGGPSAPLATATIDTTCPIFISKTNIITTMVPPVWEISWSNKPTGAAGYEWVGHTGSLVIKTLPTVSVDGSGVAPVHLSKYAGNEIIVTTQNNVRHTETGLNNLGVLDLTYKFNKTTGLTISHTLAWAVNGVVNGYPCMLTVDHAVFDRYNSLGSGVNETDLTDNDDAANFNTIKNGVYCWDFDGNAGAMMVIPNLLLTVENWAKTTTKQLWWADIAAGTWKKAYATRFESDEAYTNATVWSSEAVYRIGWFPGGANVALTGQF